MSARHDGIACLTDLICGAVKVTAEAGHHVRLLVLGGPRVGKTCICRRLLYNQFDARYKPTLEDQYSRTYQLGDTRLRVDVLDTCGDNSFPAMRRVSIINAQAILLVYSVDSYSSFLKAVDCYTEVHQLRDDVRELPTFLVGNKSDVASLERQVSNRTAAAWFYSKMSCNRGRFMECSALTGTNIDEIVRVYLLLAGIPLPLAGGNKRQLSMRLPRKRSDSPEVCPTPNKLAPPQNAAAVGWLKPRSKSLVRRSSSKKGRSCEQRNDECAVQ